MRDPVDLLPPLASREAPADSAAASSWRPIPAPHGRASRHLQRLDRTARLPRLIERSPDWPSFLRGQVVVVVGVGSVGMRIVDSLARMGVGAIWLCDDRETRATSVLTHPIAPEEIGLSKVEIAGSRARAISPATDVRVHAGPFESLPRDAIADASVVMLSSDNLAAEISVAQRALHLGRPVIQASVYGPALVAQIRCVAGGAEGAGPSLCCSFTSDEWRQLDRGTTFSCDGGSGAAGTAALPTQTPTVSPPHLCAIAADIAVGELLRLQLGLGPPRPPGETVEYNGFTTAIVRSPLERRRDCPLEHSAFDIRTSSAALESLTARDVMRIAGYSDAELRSVSVQVEGHRFVGLSTCGCPEHRPMDRFLREGAKPGPCPVCRRLAAPHPLDSHTDVPGGALNRCLDRSLGALGVESTPTLLVRGARGATLLRQPAASGAVRASADVAEAGPTPLDPEARPSVDSADTEGASSRSSSQENSPS
jgi:molybdopterin/thiamine biosynthesis adenylyltransferase